MISVSKKNNYFIGLDAGTGSVGWAVTDEEYKLLKFHGKDLWGMRCFETAQTAEGRRLQRASRRRLQRRNRRLMLLQELFAEEVTKTDPAFFQRLKESSFYKDDKNITQKNSLFNDASFTDKEYHQLYPTIHHLIKAWIDDTAKPDIRLLYLACHNIIKKRGHFLFEGNDFNSTDSFEQAITDLFEYLREDMEIEITGDAAAVISILNNQSKRPSDKQKDLYKLFKLEKSDKQKKAVMDLISGCTAQFADLFGDENFKNEEIKSLSFSKINFDKDGDMLANMLGDKFILILKAKTVYDSSVLSHILDGEKYLSYAKVKVYEKHKIDLLKLKGVIKKFYPDDYVKVFKDEKEKGNYAAYVGIAKKGNKKLPIEKTATQEDLYAFLKKILKSKGDAEENADYRYILHEMERNTFLPKQVNKTNSNVPYQVRKRELEKILQTAEKYFPYLVKKDKSGFSVSEKIIMLLTFKIPYYIGPINITHKAQFPDRCWVKKKQAKNTETITPWNFYHYIDKDATAEAFITVRTNKCRYLIGEDVLPRFSLLYSEYTVLNELNNLKIYVNGVDIFDPKLKQRIYDGVFKHHKKVTQKTIKKFLITEGICKKDDADKIILSGIDVECTSSLASFIDFQKIIGEKINVHSVQLMIEEIIRLLTIYDEGDGKEIVKAKIKRNYPNIFTDDELHKILRLRFSGWGRLSRKLLESVSADFPNCSEKINIITAMRKQNLNLMELLSTDYEFKKEVEKRNALFDDDHIKTFSYKNIVKDLFLSPSVKRSLWQTLRIVNEIVSIKKYAPKKIFIEMARGAEAEKGRTKSRKAILQQLYENCKKDSSSWADAQNHSIDELSKQLENEDNLKLRSDRLYLYYTQFGRCMYSGEQIRIDELFNTQLYDIDHIYPQSKIKDDSLTNRVLVKKSLNQDKKDVYPLNKEIQNKQKSFWGMLHVKGFISLEKLNRLTRTEELTAKELASFIARQLVETQQSTKAAASLLKQLFPETEIVYVKAGNVSAFRNKFGFIKCRELNDMHHAHDAYLNVVVGNVYHTKFTNNPWNFIKERQTKNELYDSYNFYKLFDSEVGRKNTVAWLPDKTIVQVRAVLRKNTPLYTRYAACKTGELFNQTIMKKGSGQFALKENGALQKMERYGGYNKVAAAYYVLVEYMEKEKTIRSLETVPIHILQKSKKDKSIIKKHLDSVLNVSYKIIVPRIKVNALLQINGFPCHITGKTGDMFIVRSAVQFCCKQNDVLFFKRILNYNKIQAEYAKFKISFSAYDDYTLRMFVKDEIRNEKNKSDITKDDFKKSLREKNNEVYTSLVHRYQTSIYQYRPNSKISDILENGRAVFLTLSVEEQLYVLEEVLKLFRTINENCDLTLIGGSKNSGKTTIGKKISNLDECILICQSVTGVFEKRITLKEKERKR